MPEAIATKKRSFYRALDALSTLPTTRPAEPAAKRIRRSISTTSTLSRDTARSAKGVRPGEGTERPPPNFSPWSHEAFLSRLKTFSSVSLWHPKPEPISEVEWAKRGWQCVDVNTVACRGGCEQRLVVSLDSDRLDTQTDEDVGSDEDVGEDDEDKENAMEAGLVRRYEVLIAGGHAETCLWRRSGCKDDIYHLQVVRPSIWQPELRMRYQSLEKINDSPRDIKLKALPHDTPVSMSPERLLAEVSSDLLGADDRSQPSKVSARALEIALHGWRGSSDTGNDLLHCDACFQRVGLWMYQPDYRPTHSDSDDDAEGQAVVDLIELHRDHCPWRNPDTQKASGSLSGQNASQILQRVVATYAREQRRKSNEQQRAAEQPEAEQEGNEDVNATPSPVPTKEETVRLDQERESRLSKLKSMFTIKRRSAQPKPSVKVLTK